MKVFPRISIAIALLFPLSLHATVDSSLGHLTMERAVTLALGHVSEIKKIEAEVAALANSAVAAGELEDPKLLMNLSNLPVDSFSFVQEDMTQWQVGVGQAFPKGCSKSVKRRELLHLAAAEAYRLDTAKLHIKRVVRELWLDLFYLRRAKAIIEEQVELFDYLYHVVESMVASGALQADAIRARLEVDKILNQKISIDEQLSTVESDLYYYTGVEGCDYTLPSTLPVMAAPPPYQLLEKSLEGHSEIEAERQMIGSMASEVQLRKEEYKPGWEARVVYGVRGGRKSNGEKRCDFLSAGVNIDLPLFPKNRQDRRFMASVERLHAAREERVSIYRKLIRLLKMEWQHWLELGERAHLYEESLVPRAEEYANSALVAYRNALVNFNTVSDAFLASLELQLQSVKIDVERAKARVALLYLERL